jgi:hypothetical protein
MTASHAVGGFTVSLVRFRPWPIALQHRCVARKTEEATSRYRANFLFKVFEEEPTGWTLTEPWQQLTAEGVVKPFMFSG